MEYNGKGVGKRHTPGMLALLRQGQRGVEVGKSLVRIAPQPQGG